MSIGPGSNIDLDLSKNFGRPQPGQFFPTQIHDPNVQFFREECTRLRHDKEQLTALLQASRPVHSFTSAYMRLYLLTTTLFNAYRSPDNERLDRLSEQVTTLTAKFEEFSKTTMSALTEAKLGGGCQSIFMHSKHLDRLERTGFEALQYWYRDPWMEVRNGKATVDTDDPILVLFYEDKYGELVSKSEMKAAKNTAHAYFTFLWDNNRAPTSWTNASLDLQIDFIRKLEEEYEWLRYCDRHWKSEQIFMNYYPQWYKTKNKQKGKKRKERAEDEGDEEASGNPSGSKHQRIDGQIESTPPPAQPTSTGVSVQRRRVRSLQRCIYDLLMTCRTIRCNESGTICVPVTY